MMSDQGVVPDVAEDGVQARERCTETDFDLIVTDGQMTHMNGAELSSRVCARIRRGSTSLPDRGTDRQH
jgi:two-component system sensor histidine kinase EvgS